MNVTDQKAMQLFYIFNLKILIKVFTQYGVFLITIILLTFTFKKL